MILVILVSKIRCTALPYPMIGAAGAIYISCIHVLFSHDEAGIYTTTHTTVEPVCLVPSQLAKKSVQ